MEIVSLCLMDMSQQEMLEHQRIPAGSCRYQGSFVVCPRLDWLCTSAILGKGKPSFMN